MNCDNYRPISLLSSISKILEKIVAEKLVYHLNSNDLLYQHQYGFLSKKSTEHNLMQIIDYITTALNDGMYCIGVFLDLKKAFDVCSHSILLAKLSRMGIVGTALDWFKNYLSGMSQKVDINGSLSDPPWTYPLSRAVSSAPSYSCVTSTTFGLKHLYFWFYLLTIQRDWERGKTCANSLNTSIWNCKK
jgi:hypothetical protein